MFTLHGYRFSDSFPKTETYGLTNQLRRASSSIAANIAEGCGKNTQPDLANFLYVSLGSANEAEYFVLLAKDLNYLSVQNYEVLNKLVNEIKAMLISLVSKVRG
jgi:four helix bundle protein